MMRSSIIRKGLVLGIVILFIGSCLLPGIVGKHNTSKDTVENPVTTIEVSNSATLTLRTFERTVEKQKNNVEIPADAANKIHYKLEELKQKIIYEPLCDETKALKIEFVELLDKYDLIPIGLTKDYILSLLNPSWLKNKQKTLPVRPIFPVLRNFVSRILGVFANLQQFFKMRTGKTASQDITKGIVPNSPYSQTATSIFCSMGSGGQGGTLPLFLLPRPRGIAVWSATDGTTAAASLLNAKGFRAEGPQSGLILGFVGLGLTFAFPGEMVYGFFGYAMFTSVNADEIEFFPENKAPIISDENPADGTWDVPLTLSELSFRINDPEGKLMSYTVTTNPDIGSGSGILKPNGVYSIPVSGLEYDKEYTWTVEVTDDQVTTMKQYRFNTEIGPPFDPFDEGWQYRKKITIDNSKVDGDLTSFPVLISTVDVDLRDKAQSDGDDILFMDGSGVANRLYHEIEYYEDSSGELVAWVNVPSLSSKSETVLYIYYGNPSCNNQEYPSRVWDPNYKAVYHMNYGSGGLFDSTTNNIDCNTILGSPDYQNMGRIGYAIDFEKSDGDAFEGFDIFDGEEELTVEAWINLEDYHSSHCVIASHEDAWYFYISYQYKKVIFGCHGGVSGSCAIDTIDCPLNTWYCVAGSWSDSYDRMRVYGNGVLKDTYIETLSMYTSPYNFSVGYQDNNGKFFDGTIDEIRISDIERSEEWLKTTFNTQNDPSSFFNIGPEESAP